MKTSAQIMEKAYNGDYSDSAKPDPTPDSLIKDPRDNIVTHAKSYELWNKHPNTMLFNQFLQNLADLYQESLELTTNPNTAYLAGKHVALIKRIQHYGRTGTDTYNTTTDNTTTDNT